MERSKELEIVKNLMKENFEEACSGMYFTPNVVGDRMSTLHKGEFFTLKICYNWDYYELFGCTDEEETGIEDYYKSLKEDYYVLLEGD